MTIFIFPCSIEHRFHRCK